MKSKRSALNMWVSWCLQPLRDTKADSTKTEPIVKQIANLEGASIMTGKKIVKASTKKITPLPRKAAKYASCVDEGICKLHERCARESIVADIVFLITQQMPLLQRWRMVFDMYLDQRPLQF